jgi:hypothetical protein
VCVSNATAAQVARGKKKVEAGIEATIFARRLKNKRAREVQI